MTATPSTSRSASTSTSGAKTPEPDGVDKQEVETTEEAEEEVNKDEEEVKEDGETEQPASTKAGAEVDKEDGDQDHLLIQNAGIIAQGDWQAIWSSQHNAYYFHNTRTGETTWANPLLPSDAQSQNEAYIGTTEQHDQSAAAIAAGIDPDLAYLDPSLALPSNAPLTGTFQARFNARTGAFTKADARTPAHLGEWERAQRMSAVYFDTAAYDEEVQRQKREEEESSRKRKKVTKKDLERFKEQKRLKKIAKTAWLRT